MLPQPLHHHGPDIVSEFEPLLNMCKSHGKGSGLNMGWTNNMPLGYSEESSHAASKSNQKPIFSFKSGWHTDVFAEQWPN